jgi:hypothetical protein
MEEKRRKCFLPILYIFVLVLPNCSNAVGHVQHIKGQGTCIILTWEIQIFWSFCFLATWNDESNYLRIEVSFSIIPINKILNVANLKIKVLESNNMSHGNTCQVWWRLRNLLISYGTFIKIYCMNPITCHTIAFRFILGFSTLLYTKKKIVIFRWNTLPINLKIFGELPV